MAENCKLSRRIRLEIFISNLDVSIICELSIRTQRTEVRASAFGQLSGLFYLNIPKCVKHKEDITIYSYTLEVGFDFASRIILACMVHGERSRRDSTSSLGHGGLAEVRSPTSREYKQ